jgi:hypothetical protein
VDTIHVNGEDSRNARSQAIAWLPRDGHTQEGVPQGLGAYFASGWAGAAGICGATGAAYG